MKLVASARLQKAQTRVQAARPYANKIQELLAALRSSGEAVEHPLMATRDEQKILAIVVGADRGLAGSYHSNVIRLTHRFIDSHKGVDLSLISMGTKAVASVRKMGVPVDRELTLPGADVNFGTVRPLSQRAQELFASGQVDAVYLIYTEFKSAMTQKATVQRLLPVEPPKNEDDAAAEAPPDFIFEPPPMELLQTLLSRYVDTLLFRAVLESVASEQGARMTSMTSATRNAGEMIDRLALSLNRARQAAITTEIAEIVGTAEALK